jgi:hypothetical protein
VALATFANPWHDEIGRFAPKGSGTKAPDIPGLVKFQSGANVAYADPNRKGPGNRWVEVLADEAVLFGHDQPAHLNGPEAEGRELSASPHDGTEQGISDAVRILLDQPPKVDELRARPLAWAEKWPGVWQAEHRDGWRAAYDRDAMTPDMQEKYDKVFPDAQRFGWERLVGVYVPGVKNSGKILSGKAKSLADAKAKAEKADQANIDAAWEKHQERDRRLRDEGKLTIGQFANPWHDEIGRFAPKGTGSKFGATQDEMRSLFEPVRPLVDALEGAGAKTYLVGGSVRDRLRGIDAKDIDIEVHDMSVEDTIALLEQQGARVDEVGKAFGVLKVLYGGEVHDFSFPRTEVKTGEGHTGFDVTVDPNLGIEQALARRDFTMNALAVDSDGNLVDPYGGVEDLRNGILRHVGPAFSEDPLRILRGVQFASRLGLKFDPETAKLARDLLPELENISTERVWGEFEKLGGKGTSMEAGAQALKDVGLDRRYGDIKFNGEPDLSGLSGDQRAAVALASIGVDPRQIGAPNTVARHMRDIDQALAFTGDQAASRTAARNLKYGTFEDAARIAGPNENVDPRVLTGPLPGLVTGNDVMARGIKGPAIGEVLRRVQQAQDNETIATREDALAWLDKHAQASVRRSAEFANPWHDEIGRFAEKGTGRTTFGTPVTEGDPALGDRTADHPFGTAGLAPDSKIFMVFENYPVEAYLTTGHDATGWKVNAALRSGEMTKPTQYATDGMDAAFKWAYENGTTMKKDSVVYRGVTTGEGFKLEPGTSWHDPAFTSTTTTAGTQGAKIAAAFANDGTPDDIVGHIDGTTPTTHDGAVMALRVTRDVPAMNGARDLGEAVLPRGGTYTVTSTSPPFTDSNGNQWPAMINVDWEPPG